MDSNEIIKIFNSTSSFKEACIKNNISLLNFKYLEFKDSYIINHNSIYPIMYYTLWKNNELIAVLKQAVFSGFIYQQFSTEPSRTILYITINNNFQNSGYSKKIIYEYFSFLKNLNINEKIHISPYSKHGWNYLKHNLHFFAKKFNITLIDKNYCYEL